MSRTAVPGTDELVGPSDAQLARARRMARIGAAATALAGAVLVAAIAMAFWPQDENLDGLSALGDGLGRGLLLIFGILLAVAVGVPGLTLLISGRIAKRRAIRFRTLIPAVFLGVSLAAVAVLSSLVAWAESRSEDGPTSAADEALVCSPSDEVLETTHTIPPGAHAKPGVPTWHEGAIDLLQFQARSLPSTDPRRVLATASFRPALFADGYLGRDGKGRIVATVHFSIEDDDGPPTFLVKADRVCRTQAGPAAD